MAEAATAEATPLIHGLPDEVVIWEILVRLDPKSLLRCRAVRRARRRATSTRGLLLAHHVRQPSLPILYGYSCVGNDVMSISIIPFNHQLQPVARLGHALVRPEASCDGLLVLSILGTYFAICNPATRQYAPLRMVSEFSILGMYPHRPTGEYRLLMHSSKSVKQASVLYGPCTRPSPENQVGCYVLSLGSGQRPRYIECAEAKELKLSNNSVLFRGCLHWYPVRHGSGSIMIIVFDTTAESFRLMRAPVFPGGCDDLFEMDGMLGMSSSNKAKTIIRIWVLRDYESEDWILKCKTELPVMEIRVPWDSQDHDNFWDVVVVPGDGGLLVLVKYAKSLLLVDMDDKLVATFRRKGICPTQLQLKQSLVPHAFFPSLEGYVVNDWPFI
ncbi:hypothetical protein CFC21_044016 [Triticum aestivum]|uniref:F-box associated beta-propeller type 3 domain-containing protein n=2 Tax=Triticum aestivum TaxID=4565 RepID=A0A3B6FX46_WHEAT|nr:hypothetical protein CFC21_044016 [Triticum aestivum]